MSKPTIERDWITPAGLRAVCLVVNGTWGPSHRCGYVLVPKDHPLHGKHYDDVDLSVDVHGGLTYSGKEPNYPAKAEDPWWFGFDCIHSGDAHITSSPADFPSDPCGVVRSQEYVVTECELFALQLMETSHAP